MTRRPMCLACLFIIGCFYFADFIGLPIITGSPISQNTQRWIEEHPESEIYGIIDQCEVTDYGKSVYLKNAYLIYKSKKLPIKNIKAYISSNDQANVGAYCLLSGKLERIPPKRNPGEFDSRQYYACRHIYYQMKKARIKKMSAPIDISAAILAKMKAYLQNILCAIAQEDASVFQAIILGDKRNLDEEVKIRFQMAGIMHLLSISGVHLGIIAMGLFALLQRMGLGIWPSGLLSMWLMLFYGTLTGGSSAIVRAMSMFVLMMIARITGRIYDTMTGLSIAAILLLFDTPAYLYSSSFWLSFSAVIGIGVIAPALKSLSKNKIWNKIAPGLAIQIAMLPVSLLSFGEISLAGFFLNLLILPTAGILVGSGVLALLSGLIFLPAGKLLILPGRVLLHIYEWLSDLTAGNTMMTWIAGAPKPWQVVCYIALIALMVLILTNEIVIMKKIREKVCKKMKQRIPEKIYKKDHENIYRCMTAFCLMIIAVFILTIRPLSSMRITCLDIGQGDCIVVETPEKECYMVDGGSTSKKNIGKYQIVPFLKYRGIDRITTVFVSHSDEDHISGIVEMLEMIQKRLLNIRIYRIVMPQIAEPSPAYKKLCELAEAVNIEVVTAKQGDTLTTKNTEWKILSPEKGASGKDVNEDALVLRLRHGSFLGLFMGDVGMETEEKISPLLQDVDFLKVGHHGSRYSTGEDFLEQIRPEVAAISVSAGNRYGHPAAETLERLEKIGAEIMRTDQSGAIEICESAFD